MAFSPGPRGSLPHWNPGAPLESRPDSNGGLCVAYVDRLLPSRTRNPPPHRHRERHAGQGQRTLTMAAGERRPSRKPSQEKRTSMYGGLSTNCVVNTFFANTPQSTPPPGANGEPNSRSTLPVCQTGRPANQPGLRAPCAHRVVHRCPHRAHQAKPKTKNGPWQVAPAARPRRNRLLSARGPLTL